MSGCLRVKACSANTSFYFTCEARNFKIAFAPCAYIKTVGSKHQNSCSGSSENASHAKCQHTQARWAAMSDEDVNEMTASVVHISYQVRMME